jgi:hypothetical protein
MTKKSTEEKEGYRLMSNFLDPVKVHQIKTFFE